MGCEVAESYRGAARLWPTIRIQPVRLKIRGGNTPRFQAEKKEWRPEEGLCCQNRPRGGRFSAFFRLFDHNLRQCPVTNDYEAISRFCSSQFLTPQRL